jgi:hypothetical protein
MPTEFLETRARPACSLHVDGPIAQLVEQLAFNQWVAGSSPARLKTPHRNCLDLVALLNKVTRSLCRYSFDLLLPFAMSDVLT